MKKARSMGMSRVGLVVFLISIVVFAIPSWSQTGTATLNGTAVDQQGAAVPGVAITAMSSSTGFVRKATTSKDGDFTIPYLPAGSYVVKASKDGFNQAELRNIELHTADNVTLEIK